MRSKLPCIYKSVYSIFAFLLLLSGFGRLEATERLVSGAARETLQISIYQKGNQVTFTLQRNRCADSWSFNSGYPGARSATWRVPSGFVWENDNLRRADHKCFLVVSFTAPLRAATVDRTYPLFLEVHSGLLLYLPHIMEKNVVYDSVSFHAVLDDKYCSVLSASGRCRTIRALRNAGALNDPLGYVDLGSSKPLDDLGGFNVYADPGTPVWLYRRVVRSVRDALSIGAYHLGSLPGSHIKLYLVFDDSGKGASWRGWSKGSALFFTFSGSEWLIESKGLGRIADLFATHETLHLWNAWAHHPAAGTPAWLTEGFAEYLAMLIVDERAKHLPTYTNKNFLTTVQSRINGCLQSLQPDDHGHAAPIPSKGQSVYDCGVVAEWLWDQSIKSGDIWTHWHAVLGHKIFLNTYDLDAFLKSFGAKNLPNSLVADVDWLITGGDHRHRLAATLRNHGVRVEPDVTSQTYFAALRQASLRHLLEQYCSTPPFGFTSYSDHAVIDSGNRCSVLSGNPDVIAIDGYSLFNLASIKAAAVMASKCGTNKKLTLNLVSGRNLALHCKKPFIVPLPSLRSTCRSNSLECFNRKMSEGVRGKKVSRTMLVRGRP